MPPRESCGFSRPYGQELHWLAPFTHNYTTALAVIKLTLLHAIFPIFVGLSLTTKRFAPIHPCMDSRSMCFYGGLSRERLINQLSTTKSDPQPTPHPGTCTQLSFNLPWHNGYMALLISICNEVNHSCYRHAIGSIRKSYQGDAHMTCIHNHELFGKQRCQGKLKLSWVHVPGCGMWAGEHTVLLIIGWSAFHVKDRRRSTCFYCPCRDELVRTSL